MARARSPGQYAPGTPGPPSLVPCFGPCRRGGGDRTEPPTQQQQYPQPPGLAPRCCDSPCPPCYLYPQPPIYLIYLHFTVSICKYVSPWDVATLTHPHSLSHPGSLVTVSLGLASGTSPLPRLAPPVPRRGPRHQQHLGWGGTREAALGLWPCQGVPLQLGHSVPLRTSWGLDCTFSRGPVLSEHLETWTRRVPGPDLGLGAPELSSCKPSCQTSSVLSALALDPVSSLAALSCTCPKGPRRQCLTPLFCLFRGIWPRLAVPETQFSPVLLHDFSFVHVIFFPN